MRDKDQLEREFQERLLDELQRTSERDQKRGHATFWNADRQTQSAMEVYAVREWAEVLNEQGRHIDIDSIQKNSQAYPDCLAEAFGGIIGVEVTELVDGNAIIQHRILRDFKSPLSVISIWDPDRFRKTLAGIVSKKDLRVQDSSLKKQFLLIVTDEPWLDEATVSECLREVRLRRPNNFNEVYLMLSYVPDGYGNGRYPVFKIPLREN